MLPAIASPDLAPLLAVIEPEVRALGFALVRLRLSGSGDGRTLQVMAEDPATGQLVLEQCMALSRRVSDAIDAVEAAGQELIAGAYHLEVSSPGIDRPLTRAQDFANWAGHEARLTLAPGAGGPPRLRGELLGLEAGRVAIADVRAGRVEVPLEAIEAARLVLTDKLIAATRPLDISGADEIEELNEEEEA